MNRDFQHFLKSNIVPFLGKIVQGNFVFMAERLNKYYKHQIFKNVALHGNYYNLHCNKRTGKYLPHIFLMYVAYTHYSNRTNETGNFFCIYKHLLFP